MSVSDLEICLCLDGGLPKFRCMGVFLCLDELVRVLMGNLPCLDWFACVYMGSLPVSGLGICLILEREFDCVWMEFACVWEFVCVLIVSLCLGVCPCLDWEFVCV